MISYEEAIAILFDNKRVSSVSVLVENSLNHVCTEEIKSQVFVPSFNNSAMDGFAIRAKDISTASKENPVTLQIMGSTMAGEKLAKSKTGALEIMTGAPVPAHYDAVVKVEDVSVNGNEVSFFKPVPIHNNIRDAGEDFKPDEIIIKAGTNINSTHIMALATVGQKNIEVAKKPRITIFSTGKELVNDADTPLKEGQIRNSNSPYLMAALNEMSQNATYGGTIYDEPEIFENKLKDALKNNDIIISTGAVSMGKIDFIPNSLRTLGANILFHKVLIRPGKPILYARFPNGIHYFGLPGNPISAAIGLRFFVIPLLHHLEGQKQEKPTKAKLLNSFISKNPFRVFQKAHAAISANGEMEVRILKGQQSFKINSLVKANCWAVFSPEQTEMKPNDMIDIYPLITKKWDLE